MHIMFEFPPAEFIPILYTKVVDTDIAILK